MISTRGGEIVGIGTHNGATRVFRLHLNDRGLLMRYAPELHYDSGEGYFADSAAEATDNYSSHGTNRLADDDEADIAVSDPSDAAPDLSLAYLADVYPGGRAAVPTDHIIEDSDYPAAAARMHGSNQYANQTYGRVVPISGGTVLQYWYYYYYNLGQGGFGFGDHEGDWEMTQVTLDADGAITQVTNAQHGGGE